MSSSIFQFSPLLTIFRAEAGEVTEIVTRLLIQLAVILFAAKLAGEIATRYLKLPPVLAELGSGVVIGPFALGGIAIPGFGPLFPIPEVDGAPAVIPVGNELFALAQLGSIFLLFAIGLETNLRQFLRYAGPATAVALGGLVLPFALGVGATVLLGFAEGFASPQALFMGAIMTATSVGITARVLADLNRLDSPEGVTVLAAAVVDDVGGILVLTVVVGIGTAESFSRRELFPRQRGLDCF
jgi:Kef-type K+ transport system membrane component KefB